MKSILCINFTSFSSSLVLSCTILCNATLQKYLKLSKNLNLLPTSKYETQDKINQFPHFTIILHSPELSNFSLIQGLLFVHCKFLCLCSHLYSASSTKSCPFNVSVVGHHTKMNWIRHLEVKLKFQL